MKDWEDLAHSHHREHDELQAATEAAGVSAREAHLGLASLYRQRAMMLLRGLADRLTGRKPDLRLRPPR